jgi:hypothetical protein
MYALQYPVLGSSVADPNPDPDPHGFDLFDPDLLVKGVCPDPDPSIIKQK